MTHMAAGSGRRMSSLDSFYQKKVGLPYPLFDFVTTDGSHMSTASCRDKVVLVNSWFEGCHPREPMTWLPAQLQKFGLRYPNASVVEDAHKYTFGYGFPTTTILNGDGLIAYCTSGGSSDKVKARKNVMEDFLPVIRKELAVLKSGGAY